MTAVVLVLLIAVGCASKVEGRTGTNAADGPHHLDGTAPSPTADAAPDDGSAATGGDTGIGAGGAVGGEGNVPLPLEAPLVRLELPEAGAGADATAGVENCPVPDGELGVNVSRCLVEVEEAACGGAQTCGLRFAEYVDAPLMGRPIISEWQGLPRGCVGIHQPGELDGTCPGDARLTVVQRGSGSIGRIVTREATLPGCRRPDGTCGVWMETLALGCVDPALASASMTCAPPGACHSEGFCSSSDPAPCCPGTRCQSFQGQPHCL